ncbi:MAG: DNA repair protein RadA [Dichotomicrobium sp.]
MARATSVYVCQSCGASSPRWAGKCPSCGDWNSLSEEPGAAPSGGKRARSKKPSGVRLLRLDEGGGQIAHGPTGIGELDRVLGGGLVPGSAVLLGGDPGIGKSTLLLQTAAAIAQAGHNALYFSGEEAAEQIGLRAERLDVAAAPLRVAAETNVERILATLEAEPAAHLIVIDSIQTLWTDALDSAPGSVSQVRASAQALISHAKRTGGALFLVGHVTKDGQIAGPKVVEHMVDTVLYFEGDSAQHYRLLRSVKNRFGPAGEIGAFEMRGDGLRPVANPSQLFLGDRGEKTPGAAVFAGVEGTRPLLVEIQALVAPTAFPSPRRAVVGWDANRLAMLLAVLEARCGIRLSGHDVYMNVAGGLRVAEPAADLAVAAALVSALSGVALDKDCVYFGEVSLSGAIRSVRQSDTRLREAAKLGFGAAIVPASGDIDETACDLRLDRMGHLKALAAQLSGA